MFVALALVVVFPEHRAVAAARAGLLRPPRSDGPHRPEGSNWGDFGDDDQLGRFNLWAGRGPRRGRGDPRGLRFGLSLPLDYPGGSVLAPHRQPPRLHSSRASRQAVFNYGFTRRSRRSAISAATTR